MIKYIIFSIILIINFKKYKSKKADFIYIKKKNIIHFIKCGHGDSILVEGNGFFGLIDSGNPNEFKFGKNDTSINSNVFKYLKELKVKKLAFIIGTHAHLDHIGGIQEISNEYIDNTTIYYYKTLNLKYNFDKYIDYKSYLNTINSIKKKKAKLYDITNKNITFNFGDMTISLLNTFNNNKIIYDENQNSIIVLIKYKNIAIFLPGDMTKIFDYKKFNRFGNTNIFKFPHHGFGDISFQNLRILKPSYIIISSNHLYENIIKKIKYMINNFSSKIFILNEIENSSVKLYLNTNETNNYYFDNNDTNNIILKINSNKKIYYWKYFFLIIIILIKILYLKRIHFTEKIN